MRAFRALLRLLPPAVREERTGVMERVFADMCAEWDAKRGGTGVRFWFSTVKDVVAVALVEWTSLFRRALQSFGAGNAGELMASLMTDIRFGLRQVVRQPLHGFLVILLIGMGIAGNAAMFRVFNGLFLKPLPFENAERLVDLNETAPRWDLEFVQVAYRDFAEWRRQNRTFEAMAVYDGGGANFSEDGIAERVTFLAATHDIDDVLGISPALGRFFTQEEDIPGGPRVGLISDGFWDRQFARDPGVVGRTISMGGESMEIIGVLPDEARFAGEAEVWIPLQADEGEFQGWGLSGLGRLRKDATIEQARTDLLAIHKGMVEEFDVNEITSPVVNSLRERYLGDYRLGSGILLGAVGIVLLIACANIAGLMLARGLGRAPEMAVRLALGAPRSRLVRQLLTESLILAVLGATAGTLLGVWASSFLVEGMRDQFPAWVSFDLDGRFFGFSLVATAFATIVFGLVPALQASTGVGGPVASTRTTAGAGRRRSMGVLVAGEVAMASALLVVGGLSVLDVHQLGGVDPGFDTEGILHYSLSVPTSRYATREEGEAFVQEYMARLRALPEVEQAALASSLPLGSHWGWFFEAEGAPPRAEDEPNPVVLNRAVSPEYFETMGVTLLAGRVFDDFDGREEGSLAVVVNQTFVRTHLQDDPDPVGRRIRTGEGAPWMTVVGVARDVKHYGVDEEMRPGVYQPWNQLPRPTFLVILRAPGDPEQVMGAARAVTRELDPELPLYAVGSMRQDMAEALWTRRATAWLIGAFSGVALLLAIAGLYGVISYSVAQRRQEISIRIAMGALSSQVSSQVLRQGMALVGVGVVVGLAVSLAAGGVISGVLVGVQPRDPRVYVGVAGLLLTVATVANYLPARRAASTDPMRALRGE
jgi:predicted permease